MKLYSIRHRVSGKFFHFDDRHFIHTDWDGKSHSFGEIKWSEKTKFFTGIDSVSNQLTRMASDILKDVPKRNESRYQWQTRIKPKASLVFADRAWHNFDQTKLKDIEVIVTDVSILGKRSIPATEIFNLDKREA